MKLFFLKSCNVYINICNICTIDVERKKIVLTNNEEYPIRNYELKALEMLGGANGL